MRIFKKIHQKLNWSRKQYIGLALGLLAVTYLCSAIYHTYKPIPEGLNFTGKLRHANVQFLADQTYIDANGKQQQDQKIFKEIKSKRY